MSVSSIQPAFSAGEIAPALYGRVDYKKYGIATTTLRNATVSYRGGAYSRAGTAYVLRSKTTPGAGTYAPHLVTFQFSIDEGIVLELGNQYMRFFIAGAPVVEDGLSISGITQAIPAVVTVVAHGYTTGDWVALSGINGMTQLNGQTFYITVLSANTFSLAYLDGPAVDSTTLSPYVSGGTAAKIYEISTPWIGADIVNVKYSQSADVMSFTHPSYPPYDLARISNNDWVLTISDFSTTQDAPGAPTATATTNPSGATSPPTLPCAYAYVVTALNAENEESIASPVANVTNSVNMSVTAGSIILTWPSADGALRYNIYRAPASYNTDPGNPSDALPVPVGANFYYAGTTNGLQFIDSNIITDGTRSPPQHKNPFAPGQVIYIGSSAQGAGYTTAAVTITSSTGTGFVGRAVITGGGVTGFVIDEAGENYGAMGEVVVITGDGAGATAVHLVGPTSGTYPALVSYYQQRRVYAATNNEPDTYFMSRPGQYTNFDTSFPVAANDAITGTPWAQQVNGIQWMVQMPGGLLTLTGKGAWQISGAGGNGYVPGPITPTSQIAQQSMFNGISPTVPPIAVNYDVLYVQSKGTKVLDAVYNLFTSNYTGTDQTVLSSHLFNGYEIQDWAWCEEPNKIVWVQRCDGVLLSFTYLKEQEVYGWARHDTQGKFLSITNVTEPPVDALYCVVERITAAGRVYFIERMNDRIWTSTEDPWCVDCGLRNAMTTPGVPISANSSSGLVDFETESPAFTIDDVGAVLRVAGGIATIDTFTSTTQVGGTWNLEPTEIVNYPTGNNTSTQFLICNSTDWTIKQPVNKVYGLEHLRGLYVTGLIDGIVLDPVIVGNDGAVTLPFFASCITLGLSFTVQVQTPYLDTGQPTIQGRRKNLTAVTVRVDSSAAPELGSNQPDGGAEVPTATGPVWTGMQSGAVTQDPNQVPERYTGPSGQLTTKLFSGDFRVNIQTGWNEKGQTAVQQKLPLPLSIVALVPEGLEGDLPEQTYRDRQQGGRQQGQQAPRGPGMWMLSG